MIYCGLGMIVNTGKKLNNMKYLKLSPKGKHLKVLYEDFEWDFDEEEFNNDINVGDKVKLKKKSYYRSMERSNKYRNLIFTESDQITIDETYIVIEVIEYDNKLLMTIGKSKYDTNWPWYDCKYWEVVN